MVDDSRRLERVVGLADWHTIERASHGDLASASVVSATERAILAQSQRERASIFVADTFGEHDHRIVFAHRATIFGGAQRDRLVGDFDDFVDHTVGDQHFLDEVTKLNWVVLALGLLLLGDGHGVVLSQ